MENYNLGSINIEEYFKQLIEFSKELDEEELAVVELSYANDTFESESFYPYLEGETTIQLLDGWDYTYKLRIHLLDDVGIIGGYVADWTVTAAELENANEIIFHTVQWPYADPEKDTLTFANYMASLPTNSAEVPRPEIR